MSQNFGGHLVLCATLLAAPAAAKDLSGAAVPVGHIAVPISPTSQRPPAAELAASNPARDLGHLMTEHYAWVQRENPSFARSVGEHAYDLELDDPSLEAEDLRVATARGFLTRLEAIPEDGLKPAERIDRATLLRLLSNRIEAAGFGQRLMFFTTYSSPWQSLADEADLSAFRGKADYETYLTRLGRFPAVNASLLRMMDQAVAGGYVLPCSVLGGFDRTITGLGTENPEQSRFYGPFAAAKPASINDEEWVRLQGQARALITDVLKPEFAKAGVAYSERYAPHCAQTDGVSSQPDGEAFYRFRVRQSTTTDLTPDEIHAIGLQEVDRIRARMDDVSRTAGYPSREAFVAHLRSDPRYYARTPGDLMAAAALEAKTIEARLPGFFNQLPRLPFGLKQIPAETAEGTTTTYYQSGSPQNRVAGAYYVNTSKLDQRPLWELPALTAHEAVPGHHLQIALQQELDLSPLRRQLASSTAFVEGWALYAERLGEEMGLYDTPEKMMGRLSYEMWRASRLVVDTGIHAKGWNKARAVAFMRDNTALSDANIDAEVNRYISWPGQATAYKIGEMKIVELRARAERELGDRFELAAFHDTVLSQGAVTLNILDAQVSDWIRAQQQSPIQQGQVPVQ